LKIFRAGELLTSFDPTWCYITATP